MSRPAKPAAVIKKEKKSHRTKAEMGTREKGEDSLKSGNKLKERNKIHNNLIAHKEFLRVKKLMSIIDKDDDLYSAVLNRYCLLYSECIEFEKLRDCLNSVVEFINKRLDTLEKDIDFNALASLTKAVDGLTRKTIQLDAAVMGKRKMMFDIERENVMTVSSALRSIPKEPEKEINPLLAILNAE